MEGLSWKEQFRQKAVEIRGTAEAWHKITKIAHVWAISRWTGLGYSLNHSNEQSLIASGRKTCDKS